MQRCIWLFAVLFAAVAARAADPTVFPVMKGKALTGESVSTESFRGKPYMVTVGFDRAHAQAITDWSTSFKEVFPDEMKTDLMAVVALDGALKLFRGRIDKAMAKDKPERVQKRIMTVYAADSICRELKVKDRTQVRVYVLDRDSRIVHTEVGPPSPEGISRVRAAVRKQLSAS